MGYGAYRGEMLPACGEVIEIYVLAEYQGRGKRYGFRFDVAESKIMLGTPNTEVRMIYER